MNECPISGTNPSREGEDESAWSQQAGSLSELLWGIANDTLIKIFQTVGLAAKLGVIVDSLSFMPVRLNAGNLGNSEDLEK